MKKINAIKTQLVVTTGTNLFQYWMQKNSKLNKTEPCARHNSTQNSKRRGLLDGIWPFLAFFTQSMIPADLHPDKIMPFPLSVKSYS